MIKEKIYTQSMSDFLGRIGKLLPFTPNGITYLTVVFSAIGFYFASLNRPIMALLFFLFGCGMDTLDGGLARLLKMQTHLGAFLDGTLDRFVDFLLLASFWFFALPDVILPFPLMMFALGYFTLLPTFIVAYANHRKAVDDPEEKKVWRIMHRTEMIILYFVALAVIPYNPLYASYILVLVLILNIITSFQALFLAVAKSEERKTALRIFR